MLKKQNPAGEAAGLGHMAGIPSRYLPDFLRENMKHGWEILKTELEVLFLKTLVILSSLWKVY